MNLGYIVGIPLAILSLCVTSACGIANESNPIPTKSPTPSSPDETHVLYEALVLEMGKSTSGWESYYIEQAKCLPLKHNRGNLESFQNCYSDYRMSFNKIVALNDEYIDFLDSFEPPKSVANEFAQYRATVKIAAVRLAALFEVFCSEEPHSTIDWYNCVGTNEVSEHWDRYYLLEDDIIPTKDRLSIALTRVGLPPLSNQWPTQ